MKRKNKCANKKAYNLVSTIKKQIEKTYLNHGVMLRYYECPTCLDFHLTSKNIDPEYFKKWDREIIRKEWSHFETLFNTTWQQHYGLSKNARRNRRQKENRKKRAELDAIYTKAEQQQKRDAVVSTKLSKKLEKQLSLKDAKLAIQSFKALNNLAFMKFTCLLSQFDYPQFMWKSVKKLS